MHIGSSCHCSLHRNKAEEVKILIKDNKILTKWQNNEISAC